MHLLMILSSHAKNKNASVIFTTLYNRGGLWITHELDGGNHGQSDDTIVDIHASICVVIITLFSCCSFYNVVIKAMRVGWGRLQHG